MDTDAILRPGRKAVILRFKAAVVFLLVASVAASSGRAGEPRTLVILGSSTPAGTGASAYNKSWAGRLGAHLTPRGWRVVNQALGGENTAGGLARFEKDVSGLNPDVCLIAYTLGNEGLSSSGNPAQTLQTYLANYSRLINACKAAGIVPIVAAPWPRNDYSLVHKAVNLQALAYLSAREDIHTLDFYSGVAAPMGVYLPGTYADALHPNDSGHGLMFDSIPIAIFEGSGNPQKVPRTLEGLGLLKNPGSGITLRNIDGLKSFTFGVRVAPGSAAGTYLSIGSQFTVKIEGGVWKIVLPGGTPTEVETRGASVWEHLAVSYSAERQTWILYLNGVRIAEGAEPLLPQSIALFPRAETPEGGAAGRIRDISLHRLALVPEQIGTMASGGLVRSSAELLSPCNEGPNVVTGALANFAGTRAEVVFAPSVTFSTTANVGTKTRFVNISSRVRVESSRPSIVGFVVDGTGQRILLRAVGPTLSDFGVENPLQSPSMNVHDSAGTVIASNSGWESHRDAILRATALVGAFSLRDGSSDAALVLEPPPGAYTAVVHAPAGQSGTVLIEAYDIP